MKRLEENSHVGAFIIINAANLPLGGSIGAIDLNVLRKKQSVGIERPWLYLDGDTKKEEEEEEEEDKRWREFALDLIVLSKVMIPGILIEPRAWGRGLYGRVNNAVLLITLGTYRTPQ